MEHLERRRSIIRCSGISAIIGYGHSVAGISICVPVGITRKQLRTDRSMAGIPRILSVTPFEKTPLLAVMAIECDSDKTTHSSRRVSACAVSSQPPCLRKPVRRAG